ncbi:MAG: hypothetical protein KGN77_01955 [Xanthomonadaceae bacterium]|nr:hypothetical protein [Xanthomonadaceae bacterium]
MNDMSLVIQPKSDQINAEDLLSGPRTYTIEGVTIKAGAEQPVSIALAGEKRVWRPCKTTSRILVAAWGPDANAYAGRRVTLYHDPSVKWGGLEVGGIRISHLSHLSADLNIALSETKGRRKAHTIRRLSDGSQSAAAPSRTQTDKAAEGVRALLDKVQACATLDDLRALTGDPQTIKQRTWLAANRPELAERVDTAVNDLLALFEPAAEDDFPGVVTPREDV